MTNISGFGTFRMPSMAVLKDGRGLSVNLWSDLMKFLKPRREFCLVHQQCGPP